MLKSHMHLAQYVNGVRISMRYLQTTCSVDLVKKIRSGGEVGSPYREGDAVPIKCG